MTCDYCRGTGWIVVENGEVSGMKPCACRTPVRIESSERCDPQAVAALCSKLLCLRFFPTDKEARVEIFLALGEICYTDEQAEYVVRKTLVLFNDWPGLKEMRAIYCDRFGRPRDGEMAYPDPIQFPIGYPSATRQRPVPTLPPAGSRNPELNEAVDNLAVAKLQRDLKRLPRDVQAANPDFKPITQADIDAAIEALRKKKLG